MEGQAVAPRSAARSLESPAVEAMCNGWGVATTQGCTYRSYGARESHKFGVENQSVLKFIRDIQYIVSLIVSTNKNSSSSMKRRGTSPDALLSVYPWQHLEATAVAESCFCLYQCVKEPNEPIHRFWVEMEDFDSAQTFQSLGIVTCNH